jgi:hypothetical protein
LCDGFNATFNNISAISWGSVLLVEETTDLSEVPDKLYLQNKTISQEHKDANSKTKHSTWNIKKPTPKQSTRRTKKPTPKQNNQPGTLLVEETTDLSEVPDKLYHIMLYASA